MKTKSYALLVLLVFSSGLACASSVETDDRADSTSASGCGGNGGSDETGGQGGQGGEAGSDPMLTLPNFGKIPTCKPNVCASDGSDDGMACEGDTGWCNGSSCCAWKPKPVACTDPNGCYPNCVWCWAPGTDGSPTCYGPSIYSYCGKGGEACFGCAGGALACVDGVCQ